MSLFFHEQLYRSDTLMAKLKETAITICGAGALGANLAENLARSGCGKLKVIDCDRIEERNLSTQPYQRADIGAFKAKILANSLYRAVGSVVEVETKRLLPENATKLLMNSQVVVDCFDNSVSRAAVQAACVTLKSPCLHAGLAADYAEVIWDSRYRVPSAKNDDICDYPLARNLAILTGAIAAEAVIRFLQTSEQQSYTLTLSDLSIHPFA